MGAKNIPCKRCTRNPWHPILKLAVNSVRSHSCMFLCWGHKQTQLSVPELFLRRKRTLNQLLCVRKHWTCNPSNSSLLVLTPPYLHLNSVVNDLWGQCGTLTQVQELSWSTHHLLYDSYFPFILNAVFYINFIQLSCILDNFKGRLQTLQ